MIKQNISIVGIPILYNILEEIKDNLSFKVKNFNENNDFSKFLIDSKAGNKNYFIVTSINNKDFFLKKIKMDLKNIFFLCQKNNKIGCDDSYNVIKYPIDIYNLIEKINIQLIKYKYSSQSKILVKKYSLDLNSRVISKDKNKLKLTEREMEIIFFLNENKTTKKITNLQNKVWCHSSKLETHTVETHVYRLRKKISDSFNDEKFLLSTDDGYLIE